MKRGEWSFVDAGKWLSEILSGLRDPEGLDAGGCSGDFRGTLRHYQETGHNWLWFLSSLGLGACLADDMGLGKTIQVLSVLLAMKGENKKARQTVAPRGSRVAPGQLEGGDETIRPDPRGPFRPPLGIGQGSARPPSAGTRAGPWRRRTWS